MSTNHLLFEAFGLVGEVFSDDRDLLEAVHGVLPPSWLPTEREPAIRFGLTREGVITVDGSRVHAENDSHAMLQRLGSEIRHRFAEAAPDHVFIHAGVVRIEDCGVVMPGSTHSGKTTLVAALVRAGAKYYSDEYAVVDADGTIQPFAKPLSVRSSNGFGFGKPVPVSPSQIGTAPLNARLIVFANYERGARWRPAVCGRAEGAFELLRYTVNARRRPTAALVAVGQLCRDARILEGPRGEASETASALLNAIDTLVGVG